MTHRLTVAALLAVTVSASAADLGTYGDTWDIREHDLIAVLKRNLASRFAGQSQAETEQAMRQRVEEDVLRPPAVEGLVTGRETHSRLFDPTFTVTRDIADQNGTVFAHRGQKVNPFDVMPVFDETLYFVDGDDPRQVAWMRQQQAHTTLTRIILVNGNVKESATALGSRVFFDQNGTLTTKFGIRQVPAEVRQAPGQKRFLITEFGLPDR